MKEQSPELAAAYLEGRFDVGQDVIATLDQLSHDYTADRTKILGEVRRAVMKTAFDVDTQEAA